jgi:hypothetical protein
MKCFFSIASFDDSLESLRVFIPKGQAVVKYKTAGNILILPQDYTRQRGRIFIEKKSNIVRISAVY